VNQLAERAPTVHALAHSYPAQRHRRARPGRLTVRPSVRIRCFELPPLPPLPHPWRVAQRQPSDGCESDRIRNRAKRPGRRARLECPVKLGRCSGRCVRAAVMVNLSSAPVSVW
jgi:hypothetical protein